MNDVLPADLRLILAHRQATSARVRFLRFAHGPCAFNPLPEHAVVEETRANGLPVAYHPRGWLRTAARRLGLDDQAPGVAPDFPTVVRTPDGPVTVQMATLNTVDPPFAQAELRLLRRAYAALMG